MLLDTLYELEKVVNYRVAPPTGVKPFCIEGGFRPILLSAPHATQHTRANEPKMEEEFTAAFARYLSAKTGCHAIYTVYRQGEDPNWDTESSYKRAVADIVKRYGIRTVVDLHGMTNRHNIGVALGTMHGRSLDQRLTDIRTPFLQNGFVETDVSELELLDNQDCFRLVVDHPKFTGGLKSNTVTRFAVEELGVQALQIELTSAIRIVHRGPHDGWPFEFRGLPEGIESATRSLLGLIDTLSP